jgi:hypothetical protein
MKRMLHLRPILTLGNAAHGAAGCMGSDGFETTASARAGVGTTA